jgi:hypothetical protein
MELALAVPADAAPAEALAQIAAASAASDGGAGSAGASQPDADDEGWITVGTIRANRMAAAKGGGGSANTCTQAAAPPTQAEILFSTDISTGLPIPGPEPAPPLDAAAAAAAAAELLDMGFDSDRVQVSSRARVDHMHSLPAAVIFFIRHQHARLSETRQVALAACGSRMGSGDAVIQAAVAWLMDNPG